MVTLPTCFFHVFGSSLLWRLIKIHMLIRTGFTSHIRRGSAKFRRGSVYLLIGIYIYTMIVGETILDQVQYIPDEQRGTALNPTCPPSHW